MDFDAVEFTRQLLKKPTERDKQIKVGASNLSSPCGRCLAEQMATGQESTNSESPYWLGAVIGTAIHNMLEVRGTGIEGWIPESRVVLGDIDGYGKVKSTSDGFWLPGGEVVDFKTTTREKLKYIKRAIDEKPSEYEITKVSESRYKVDTYRNQLLLYGLGQENAGHEVNTCTIVFVCRDGVGDSDIWGTSFPYDRERALTVWQRGVRLWAWLQEGHKPEELKSAQYCYTCSRRED